MTTKNVGDVIAELEQQTGSGRVRAKQNRTYTVSTGGDVKAQLAPQARKIVVAVLKAKADEGKITESELDTLLKESGISEKQDPFRVWQFHRKAIIEAGWMTLQEPAAKE